MPCDNAIWASAGAAFVSILAEGSIGPLSSGYLSARARTQDPSEFSDDVRAPAVVAERRWIGRDRKQPGCVAEQQPCLGSRQAGAWAQNFTCKTGDAMRCDARRSKRVSGLVDSAPNKSNPGWRLRGRQVEGVLCGESVVCCTGEKERKKERGRPRREQTDKGPG
jgi:hypothetical protein